MKYGKNTRKAALALILLSAVMPQSSYAYRNDGDTVRAISAVVAGVAFGAVCVYGLMRWFYPSDQEIIDAATHDLRTAGRMYQDTLVILDGEQAFYSAYGTSVELFLENVATRLFKGYTAYPYYLTAKAIDGQVATLIAARAKVYTRLSKLGSDSQALLTRHQMQQLLTELDHLSAALSSAAVFFKQHESYFVLFYKQDQLITLCGESLHALQLYAYDREQLLHQIRLNIVQVETSSYPYTNYVIRLDKLIASYADALHNVYYKYPLLRVSASDFLQQVKNIRAYIVTDFAYTQEQQHRQSMEAERERTRVMQEQAQAQQTQAYAQIRQAQAQERQARAQEDQARQLRLQRQQAQDPQVIIVA